MVTTKQTKKVDTLGRITIPKSVRTEVGFNSGDEIEFYRYEDETGTYIAMKKVADGENAEIHDDIAVQVLTDLGCEVPRALSDRIATRKAAKSLETKEDIILDDAE